MSGGPGPGTQTGIQPNIVDTHSDFLGRAYRGVGGALSIGRTLSNGMQATRKQRKADADPRAPVGSERQSEGGSAR